MNSKPGREIPLEKKLERHGTIPGTPYITLDNILQKS
jgi:hypothetical protein